MTWLVLAAVPVALMVDRLFGEPPVQVRPVVGMGRCLSLAGDRLLHLRPLQALWGYRGPCEWAGKWAARADHLLSWLPAGLTAALRFVVATRWPQWPALAADARRTPSPNGGWPIGAMAQLLGVGLSKPGVYVLPASGGVAEPADTQLALTWAGPAVWAAGVLACGGISSLAGWPWP